MRTIDSVQWCVNETCSHAERDPSAIFYPETIKFNNLRVRVRAFVYGLSMDEWSAPCMWLIKYDTTISGCHRWHPHGTYRKFSIIVCTTAHSPNPTLALTVERIHHIIIFNYAMGGCRPTKFRPGCARGCGGYKHARKSL